VPSITDVVRSEACSGCGACSVATAGRIPVVLRLGRYGAVLDGVAEPDLVRGSAVCPFADESPDEDSVAAQHFPSAQHFTAGIGRYETLTAVRVNDDDYVRDSSSGGGTSWYVRQLLERDIVDGVVHVGRGEDSLFGYRVSYSHAELIEARKSAYYSTTLADVLNSIRGDGARYALVGVPCFITGARHLASQDKVLASQLTHFVGLVCGHLKSHHFAEALAWQTGVAPDDLKSVDFRVKDPSARASNYVFEATSSETGETLARPSRELLGANWGHAMFQLKACNFCDDIFAETADITFGDAWIDRFTQDWRGTNVAVARTPIAARIVADGHENGSLSVEPLSPDDALRSQRGNFRHRWEGLAYRLYQENQSGRWAPKKRIAPSLNHLSARRRRILDMREALRTASESAFQHALEQRSLSPFMRPLSRLAFRYTVADKGLVRAWGLRLVPQKLLSSLRDSVAVSSMWKLGQK